MAPAIKKGIILAGGKGSRLHPVTLSMGKPLLPVYDKPLIYYPLSTLMNLGIKDILLITTDRDQPLFEQLLGDGSALGINLTYQVQSQPRGIPDAFIIGEEFIGSDHVALILGDNIFHPIERIVEGLQTFNGHGMIFAYPVKNPTAFGVVEINSNGKLISLEEKPANPKSDLAVVGLYLFDPTVIDIAKSLKPSKRGELEILDPVKSYLSKGKLQLINLGPEFSWFDAGSADSLAEAGEFVKFAERQIDDKIGSIELTALKQGFIDNSQFAKLLENMPECSYKTALNAYTDNN